jgi:hypothetical protein
MIRNAQREELADLELGDALGKSSMAEISRVDVCRWRMAWRFPSL